MYEEKLKEIEEIAKVIDPANIFLDECEKVVEDNFKRSIVGIEFDEKDRCVALKGVCRARDLKRVGFEKMIDLILEDERFKK